MMSDPTERQLREDLEELTDDGDDAEEKPTINVREVSIREDTIVIYDWDDDSGEYPRELTHEEYREEFGHAVEDIDPIADFTNTTT